MRSGTKVGQFLRIFPPNFVLIILPYICSLFFLSMQLIVECFVIDFAATVLD